MKELNEEILNNALFLSQTGVPELAIELLSNYDGTIKLRKSLVKIYEIKKKIEEKKLLNSNLQFKFSKEVEDKKKTLNENVK